MMHAGKDYIAKGESEYESPRAKYLRELLLSMKAQSGDVEQPAKPEAGPVKPINQSKPTLKLR